MITQKELLEIWGCDSTTGALVWKTSSTHRSAGDPVNLSQKKQRIGPNRYNTASLVSLFYTGSTGNTKVSNPITQRELHSILEYSRSTGIFTWKENRGSAAKFGEVAGCTQCKEHPYTMITIAGKQYYAHRLAWLYVY